MFSLLAGDGQYVPLYLLESTVGYMAVKTTEQDVCLVSSFDAGFLAKSNIDAV